MRIGLCVVLVGLLLVGCSDGKASGGSTPPATSTVAIPSETPTAPSGVGKVPDSSPPRTWRDPRVAKPLPDSKLNADHLVIYTDELGTEGAGGRSYPTLEIVTYDLDAGQVVAVTHAGALDDYVNGAFLAGRSLVVRYDDRVVVSGLDGSGSRTLFKAPPDTLTASVAVSPDGTLVAVSVEPADLMNVTLSFLSFLDVRTGQELSRISYQTFQAAGVPGTPGVRNWWGDDSAVEIYGVLHKGGGPLPTGTAYRDGRVVKHDYWLQTMSADGRVGAYSLGQNVYFCDSMGATAPGIQVIGLPAGNTVMSFQRSGVVATSEQFSPDGTELLFRTNPLDVNSSGQPCFRWEPAWHVLSSKGVTDVSDVGAVMRGWNGNRYVETGCADPTLNDQLPGSWLVTCGNMYDRPLANLIVGGKAIDQVHEGHVVGFIDPGQ